MKRACVAPREHFYLPCVHYVRPSKPKFKKVQSPRRRAHSERIHNTQLWCTLGLRLLSPLGRVVAVDRATSGERRPFGDARVIFHSDTSALSSGRYITELIARHRDARVNSSWTRRRGYRRGAGRQGVVARSARFTANSGPRMCVNTLEKYTYSRRHDNTSEDE